MQSIFLRTWLRPLTSTREFMTTVSRTPSKGGVRRLAMVETIIFGKPIGSSRITIAASRVPCPPPREIAPSIFFSQQSLRMIAAEPRPMTSKL